MNRKQYLYWICQTSGWSFYSLASIAISASFQAASWKAALVAAFNSAIGFVLTHWYREIIRKWGWTSFTLKKVVPLIIAVSIVLGFVWVVIALTAWVAVFQIFTLATFQHGIAVVTWFNWSATILIWSLIYFSIHIFQNYKREEIQRWQLQAAVKDAELLALKAQMNPHFLFNSLNNLEELILEDPQRAREAVSKLSALLRYALQSGSAKTVTLEEELRVVRHYLDLEYIRFEDRLQTMFVIEPSTLAAHIPPMLLQTLVENGIKHGIAKRPQGGMITITSAMTGNLLRLAVSNDGVLESVSDRKGLGIANTQERLRLVFGEQAVFALTGGVSEHVTAHVTIPCIAESERESGENIELISGEEKSGEAV